MIPATQARALFTQALVDTYREMPKPTMFLQSFGRVSLNNSRYVSIEVERGTEKVAVDVIRGSEGNRNTFGKSTEKVIDPPYFNETFDLTELYHYDLAFGATRINESAIADLAAESARRTMSIQAKIERAYEKMWSEVFETGIVTLKNGDNIDFKRKAGSLVDATSNTWATGSNDPRTNLISACQWIRQNGKSQGNVFNAILGSTALAALLKNSTITTAGDILRIDSMMINEPQRNAVGATSHGYINAGDYIVRLWSYPEFYDNASGTSTPYLNPKKVIVLPESPRFTMAFAGVPRLINGSTQYAPQAYFIDNIQDERKVADEIRVRSAGTPVPVAVDQIYTMQVIA